MQLTVSKNLNGRYDGILLFLISSLPSQAQIQANEWREQVEKNRQLRSELALLDFGPTSDPALPPAPALSLYSCAECPHVKLSELRAAFVHHDVFHGEGSKETEGSFKLLIF